MAMNKAKTGTIDIVDYLKEKMEEKTGIPFARDAWENAAPGEYGVVELGDMVDAQWADGELIDCVWAITITLYVTSPSDIWPDAVKKALAELKDAEILSATHYAGRSFEMDTGKIKWTWNLRAYGPLTMERAENGTA